MPQAQQADPVDRFIALPPDQQKKMYEGLSDPAKKKLAASIQERKQKKTAAPPKPPGPSAMSEFGSDLWNIAKGTGQAMATGPVGMSYQAGKKALSEFQALRTGGKTPEQEHEEAQKKAGYPAWYRYGATPTAEAIGVNVPGMEKAAAEGKPAHVIAHAAAPLAAMAITEVGGRVGAKAIKLAKEGVPPSVTKAATKQVIQKHLFDRATAVQEHIQAAADSAKAEDAAHWKHLEETIDGAKPQGSIDVGNLRAEAQSAVQEAIKTPQKLPATVETIRKGAEPPKVFGERLNLSNPSHKALYDTLKEQGAIPEDRDVITFAEAKQIRTKLGTELRRGTTLSGEAKAVGWKVYNGLTDAMSKAAAQENLSGAFADANRLHSEYMDAFVDKKSPLARSLRGNNPHEIVGPFSDPRFAEQARRTMAKYQRHGLDPKQLNREGIIFQKLKSGLPYQYPARSWEIGADVIAAGSLVGGALTGEPVALAGGAAALATPARLGVNWAKRAGAIREVEAPQTFSGTREPMQQPMRGETGAEAFERGGIPQDPNPPQAPHSNTAAGAARHAQALKMASEKLGKGASIRELLAEADRIERGMR